MESIRDIHQERNDKENDAENDQMQPPEPGAMPFCFLSECGLRRSIFLTLLNIVDSEFFACRVIGPLMV